MTWGTGRGRARGRESEVTRDQHSDLLMSLVVKESKETRVACKSKESSTERTSKRQHYSKREANKNARIGRHRCLPHATTCIYK